MSRPEDPLGGKSYLTSQSSGQMSEQVRQEDIERRRAANAQATRRAQAQPSAPLPKLPPAANLRSPQRAANRPTTTSAPPPGDAFAGIKPRPPSSLDPEIMPPPPQGSRRLGPILIRSILMVGFAAIVAYGITMFSSFQPDSRAPKSSSDGASIGQMSHEPASDAQQRLAVEDQQAFANEPIWLGVVAAPATSSGALSLRGLAHGRDCPQA